MSCDGVVIGLPLDGEKCYSSEHQHARFHLSFHGERHVHGHLVAVEVCVISGRRADDADCFAFDQRGLKSLITIGAESARLSSTGWPS